MIQIFSSVVDFYFLSSDGQAQKGSVGQLHSFDFSQWTPNLIVTLNLEKLSVNIDLHGRDENTKVKSLYWENFNNEELNFIARTFSLVSEKVLAEDSPSNLSLRIPATNRRKLSPVQMAIKKLPTDENFIFVIFYLDYPDRTFTGELLIHGIWEVKATDEFTRKFLR